MDPPVLFHVGKFKVEVELTKDGEGLRIRSRDGVLAVKPVMANVVEVSVDYLWDTQTKIKIAANIISKFRRSARRRAVSSESIAKEIVRVLEGQD